MRNESHHHIAIATTGGLVLPRSASAAAPRDLRIRTSGAGGPQYAGAIPGSAATAVRGRSTELRLVRRVAPVSPSRPARLSSHPTPPVGKAGVKKENR